MNRARIKALLAIGLMVLASIGARAWRPSAYLADSLPKVDLEQLFPTQFGAWRVDTRMPLQLVSPDQQAMIDRIYAQTLSRNYVDAEGRRIMLSVAYGGDQSRATRAHRPEVCYPAQGFEIIADSKAMVRVLGQDMPLHRLVARQGGRVEPISYWLMVGDRAVLTSTTQRVAQLSYTTRGLIPDGMLVRVSNIGSDAQQSYLLHDDFIRALAGVLDRAALLRMTGLHAAPAS